MSAKRLQTAADMYECSYAIHFMGRQTVLNVTLLLFVELRKFCQVDGVDEVLSDFNPGGCEDVTTISVKCKAMEAK